MSNRWPGGIIRKTPVTPTGPYQNGTAPGVWTLADAAYWTKQGLWPTAGNFLAVEDVFSTYLYTGNGSTQTITNGIDLAGKGGMVWIKNRGIAQSHILTDTARGTSKFIASNLTNAEINPGAVSVTSFNSNGFGMTWGSGFGANVNDNASNYASWTFREAPNFFDVVTYTGNGSVQLINHNLGSTPGMIIIKRTDNTSDWAVWHRSSPINGLFLNTTAAAQSASSISSVNATRFGVSTTAPIDLSVSGATYVAYLFAHDTTSDGIIQCGSFTTDGSGAATVNLGWEPQWAMVKRTDSTSEWFMNDNMRGMPVTGSGASLYANRSFAEDTSFSVVKPTSTGFTPSSLSASATYIYIAIRRGPMRTPTSGTSVFSPNTTSTDTATTGFPVDLLIEQPRTSAVGAYWVDRLRGGGLTLKSASTSAESASLSSTWSQNNTGVSDTGFGFGSSVMWNFRRAPSFFDVVCYTGTGVAGRTVNHNLGVAPELMIVKRRNGATNWPVYSSVLGATKYLFLNLTNASDASDYWNNTSPTATQFSVDGSSVVNANGGTYVAYLFASCPGVSKVGSYTGTGALQTINCGFTTGARFVLIKRTDSTGDWFVWDSARGITSGNDPYLLLNSTAAEVTGTNYVDTDTTGFKVTAAAPAGINASGGSYIFLAVA